MSENSLTVLFKNKGRHLPFFINKTKEETLEVEPCSLVSSKPRMSRHFDQIDLPDLAIFFPGITLDKIEENERDSSLPNDNNEKITPESQLPPTIEGWRRFTGVLLALTATFVYSLATLIVKLFREYHPFVLSIWRFQGMIIPSVPIILFYIYGEKQKVFKGVWPMTKSKNIKSIIFIFLRSLIGCTATVAQIYAVQKMNMADASVIVFSSPVFVTLAAHLFLGEKAGFFSVLMALFTFAGVAVIARPPMLTGASLDADTLIGTAFAVAAMLLSASVFIILRYLRDVHYSVVTLSYGILGSLECVAMAAVFDVFDIPHGVWEWLLAAGLIIFTFMGQTAVVLALKFENAGLVSLIGSTDVVFAFLWQFVFLSVLPDMYSIIGAFIVVLGVILTTVRKWIGTLNEDNPTRRKLSWFLK